MLDIKRYAGKKDGPHLLITGAVHGDEVCGPMAIAKDFAIKRGNLTVIPICNPRAYAEEKRYIEHNLNRKLYPKDDPQYYEDHLANILCPVLAEADVLLDLHSYSRGGLPFIYLGPENQEEWNFAAILGAKHCIRGFAAAYQNAGIKIDKDEGMGTTEYMRLHGGYGVTLECGGHNDPQSILVARAAIENALVYFDMIDGSVVPVDMHEYVCTHVFYMEEDGDLLKSWDNFEYVVKDTVLARYISGREVLAPYDGYIMMPDLRLPKGEEWFYFGTKKE